MDESEGLFNDPNIAKLFYNANHASNPFIIKLSKLREEEEWRLQISPSVNNDPRKATKTDQNLIIRNTPTGFFSSTGQHNFTSNLRNRKKGWNKFLNKKESWIDGGDLRYLKNWNQKFLQKNKKLNKLEKNLIFPDQGGPLLGWWSPIFHFLPCLKETVWNRTRIIEQSSRVTVGIATLLSQYLKWPRSNLREQNHRSRENRERKEKEIDRH